jgi:hypothetical protein
MSSLPSYAAALQRPGRVRLAQGVTVVTSALIPSYSVAALQVSSLPSYAAAAQRLGLVRHVQPCLLGLTPDLRQQTLLCC